ncbi:gamma-aminobutyric acid type B receptor subunit 1-like [Ptychodera flava]|uniref:gamma-aminobutyric acid type B receptor subunit 1-like n=1 Tax=Ptychodera flava TaxID=63121 RepID=UPI00396A3433
MTLDMPRLIHYYLMAISLAIAITSESESQGKEPMFLHVGGFFISELSNAQFTGYNGTIRAAYSALQHINSHPDVDEILQGYRLQMSWQPSQCDPASGLKALYDTIYTEPTKIMLFGPFCSTAAQRIAETAEQWDLATFSYGASSAALSDKSRYPLFLRTAMAAPDKHNPARLALLMRFNWKKVALITQNEDLFTQTVKALLVDLEENGIDVLTNELFDLDPSASLANIKKKDARIIIASFYPDVGLHVFCEAFKQGVYGPKFVWMTEGWFNEGWWAVTDKQVDCTTEQLSEVAEGYLGTSWLRRNPDLNTIDFGVSTTSEMKEYFEDNDDGPFAPIVYDGTWAVALTLNASICKLANKSKRLEDYYYGNREMADIIVDAGYDVSFTGYSGRLSITRNGRDGVVRIAQTQDNNFVAVGTYANGLLALHEDKIAWSTGKIPRDSPRTVNIDVEIKEDAVAVFSSFAVVGTLLAIGFLAFNIRYRAERIIRMSSPNLNNAIAIGCILVYITVILLGSVFRQYYATICKDSDVGWVSTTVELASLQKKAIDFINGLIPVKCEKYI